MELRVQRAPGLLAGDRLERAALRIAPEHQVRTAGQRACPNHAAILQPDARTGRDVAAGLDDTIVTERNADSGVGADQAAFADRDLDLSAARERAHDRRAAADIAAVAHHDSGTDAAFDHAGAERACIEVAEAL